MSAALKQENMEVEDGTLEEYEKYRASKENSKNGQSREGIDATNLDVNRNRDLMLKIARDKAEPKTKVDRFMKAYSRTFMSALAAQRTGAGIYSATKDFAKLMQKRDEILQSSTKAFSAEQREMLKLSIAKVDADADGSAVATAAASLKATYEMHNTAHRLARVLGDKPVALKEDAKGKVEFSLENEQKEELRLRAAQDFFGKVDASVKSEGMRDKRISAYRSLAASMVAYDAYKNFKASAVEAQPALKAEAKPEKRGFWARLFGRSKPEMRVEAVQADPNRIKRTDYLNKAKQAFKNFERSMEAVREVEPKDTGHTVLDIICSKVESQGIIAAISSAMILKETAQAKGVTPDVFEEKSERVKNEIRRYKEAVLTTKLKVEGAPAGQAQASQSFQTAAANGNEKADAVLDLEELKALGANVDAKRDAEAEPFIEEIEIVLPNEQGSAVVSKEKREEPEQKVLSKLPFEEAASITCIKDERGVSKVLPKGEYEHFTLEGVDPDVLYSNAVGLREDDGGRVKIYDHSPRTGNAWNNASTPSW